MLSSLSYLNVRMDRSAGSAHRRRIEDTARSRTRHARLGYRCVVEDPSKTIAEQRGESHVVEQPGPFVGPEVLEDPDRDRCVGPAVEGRRRVEHTRGEPYRASQLLHDGRSEDPADRIVKALQAEGVGRPLVRAHPFVVDAVEEPQGSGRPGVGLASIADLTRQIFGGEVRGSLSPVFPALRRALPMTILAFLVARPKLHAFETQV